LCMHRWKHHGPSSASRRRPHGMSVRFHRWPTACVLPTVATAADLAGAPPHRWAPWFAIWSRTPLILILIPSLKKDLSDVNLRIIRAKSENTQKFFKLVTPPQSTKNYFFYINKQYVRNREKCKNGVLFAPDLAMPWPLTEKFGGFVTARETPDPAA